MGGWHHGVDVRISEWHLRNGNLDVVKALLAAKAKVNAKVLVEFTALYMASTNGHVEVVWALLTANADVNLKHSPHFPAT